MPTPPDPAQMTTSLRSISSSTLTTASARALDRQPLERPRGPTSGVSRNGSVTTGASTPRFEPARPGSAGCGARSCAASAAVQRLARGRRAGAVHRRHGLGLGAAEALGQHPVDQHGGELHPELRPRSRSSRSIVSFTGISSASATATTAVSAGVGHELVDPVRRGCGSGRRARCPRRCGARAAAPPVAGGGRVHDRHVVRGCRAPSRRSSWASSQILPSVTSSASPGAAAVRYWKMRLLLSRPARRAGVQLEPQPLLLGVVGVDRDRGQVRRPPRVSLKPAGAHAERSR